MKRDDKSHNKYKKSSHKSQSDTKFQFLVVMPHAEQMGNESLSGALLQPPKIKLIYEKRH